jgi:hypothetical protein
MQTERLREEVQLLLRFFQKQIPQKGGGGDFNKLKELYNLFGS